jgi:two-component system, chemotaxis family, response regulator Rcp1
MSSEPKEQTFQILLVEDNPGDIYLFRQALKGAGLNFELTVIEDGAEALAFAKRDGKYAGSPVPDLAVLDVNLPKIQGTEVLGAMRQNEELAHVPVALMTSSATPGDQAMSKEFNVTRYIMKPLDLEDFLQIGKVLKQLLLERSPHWL